MYRRCWLLAGWLAPMRPGCFFFNLILLLIQFQPLVVMLSILYSSAGGAHTPRHKNSPENSRFSKKESKEETGIERQSIGTNATSIIVSPKGGYAKRKVLVGSGFRPGICGSHTLRKSTNRSFIVQTDINNCVAPHARARGSH